MQNLQVLPSESFLEFANSTISGLHIPRIHRFEGGRCTWTWDEPLRLLSVSDENEAVVSLPLASLHTCAASLERLDPSSFALLTHALEDVSDALDLWNGDPPWDGEVRDAVGLLLMFVLAAAVTRRHDRLVSAARRVATRMLPEGPRGAWYVAFQSHLPFAHRAGVLASASGLPMPVPDLVWWTAKCRLDLAVVRAGAVRVDDADALRELVDAATSYIHLLQKEPSRLAVERFYTAAGTTSEAEVLRAHTVREEYTNVDEVERSEVMTWLLKRYALEETWALLRKTLRRREIIGGWVALVMAFLGIALFVGRTNPRWQIAAQLAGFGCLVYYSPRIFSLLLPRAMFGTLLAWITVVVAQSASLLPIITEKDGAAVRESCHKWLREIVNHPGEKLDGWFRGMFLEHRFDPPQFVDFSLIVIACLSVSAVFLMIEVSNRLSRPQIRRSIDCVLVMLLGSMFWGAMLVPTLQYIVAREPLGSSCGCVYPAWLLGSVCAVAFGILVQLIWDDRAVSEAVGAR